MKLRDPEQIKDNLRMLVKIIFSILMIVLPFIYRMPYGYGFIMGSMFIGYLFLFPSPIGLVMLDKVFNYSDKIAVIMKNESENNDEKYQKIKNKGQVKYKK